jgi:hypothetical protein
VRALSSLARGAAGSAHSFVPMQGFGPRGATEGGLDILMTVNFDKSPVPYSGGAMIATEQ